MKRAGARHVGEAIAAAIEQLGIGKKLQRYELFERWKEIVGQHIAEVTKPDRMDGTTLFVKVARSTWRNELVFLKKDLIVKINETIGEQVVSDIIFR